MSSVHPLETYISPRIRRPPPFIYLHHPFHSSSQALPPSIRSDQGEVPSLVALNQQRDRSFPSARIQNAKLILTIPSSYVSSSKSFYTTIIHLVHLCLFPDKLQQEIQARGRFKEVFQWDTFVRALSRVLDVYEEIAVGEGGTNGVDKGMKSEMKMSMVDGNQVGMKRKRFDGNDVRGNGKLKLALMLVLQDAQALPKALDTTFESLLRLPKMIEHPISIVLTSPKPWDDLRPTSGSGGEPIGLFLAKETKEEIISALLLIGPGPADRAAPVYPYFLSLLYATSAHLIPSDLVPTLTRMKEALWPIYFDGLGEGARANNTRRGGDDAMQVDGAEKQNGETPPTAGLRVTTSLLIELKNRSTYAFALANEHLISNTIPVHTFLEAFFPTASSGVSGIGKPAGPKTDAEKAFFDLIPSIEKDRGEDIAGPSPSNEIVASGSRFTTLNPNPIVLRPACTALPLYAKYLVVAAYCASYNSVKSDMRMFGRGPLTGGGRGGVGQERSGAGYEGGGKAGGKTGHGLKKVKLGRVGKVPQYLLGPRSFPLERLLAIFQALLFEHGFDPTKYDSDTDGETEDPQRDLNGDEADDAFSDANQPAGKLDFRIDEDASRLERKRRERQRRRDKERLRDWEEEVEEISRSVGLFGLIPELENMRLLQRTTPKDRLDGILIRCEAPKEMVTTFARSLKIDLKGYLLESE